MKKKIELNDFSENNNQIKAYKLNSLSYMLTLYPEKHLNNIIIFSPPIFYDLIYYNIN
jgi:hypothetical protein